MDKQDKIKKLEKDNPFVLHAANMNSCTPNAVIMANAILALVYEVSELREELGGWLAHFDESGIKDR